MFTELRGGYLLAHHLEDVVQAAHALDDIFRQFLSDDRLDRRDHVYGIERREDQFVFESVFDPTHYGYQGLDNRWVFSRLREPGQYLAIDGSICSTQASIPPVKLRTFVKPCPIK